MINIMLKRKLVLTMMNCIDVKLNLWIARTEDWTLKLSNYRMSSKLAYFTRDIQPAATITSHIPCFKGPTFRMVILCDVKMTPPECGMTVFYIFPNIWSRSERGGMWGVTFYYTRKDTLIILLNNLVHLKHLEEPQDTKLTCSPLQETWSAARKTLSCLRSRAASVTTRRPSWRRTSSGSSWHCSSPSLRTSVNTPDN